MSPSEPPIRISDPSASRYALDTHCCAGRPPPRSRSIAGSATFTIVPSIVATAEPRIAATRVSRWRCDIRGGGRVSIKLRSYTVVNDARERVPLGRTALGVTRLGLGTAPLGGLYEPVAEEAAHAVVERAW